MAKISVSWAQLGYFFQKTTVNVSGKRSCEYYYKLKTSKPCELFILKGKKTKQLQTYHAISKDLRDLKIVLEEYNRLYKEIASSELGEDKIYSMKIILKALRQSIVITYSKFFISTESRNKPNDKIIKGEDKASHKKLISMRNQWLAHAGKSEYEKLRIICPISSMKKLRKKQGASVPFVQRNC